LSARYVDRHDVHAFCERTRDAIELVEERAKVAATPGWVAERREYLDHARAQLRRAQRVLDELLECLEHTLAKDEAAQEEEARALLGDGDPLPAEPGRPGD